MATTSSLSDNLDFVIFLILFKWKGLSKIDCINSILKLNYIFVFKYQIIHQNLKPIPDRIVKNQKKNRKFSNKLPKIEK